MHHSKNSSASFKTCEHEYLVPDTEGNTMDNAHRVDIPPSLNSVAAKGKHKTLQTNKVQILMRLPKVLLIS